MGLFHSVYAHRTSIAIRVAGSSNTVTLQEGLQHLWIREGIQCCSILFGHR